MSIYHRHLDKAWGQTRSDGLGARSVKHRGRSVERSTDSTNNLHCHTQRRQVTEKEECFNGVKSPFCKISIIMSVLLVAQTVWMLFCLVLGPLPF